MQKKLRFMLQRLLYAALLLILFSGLALVIGCSGGGGGGNGNGGIVATEFGSLKGYAASGAYVYKGIPYAAPPVGDLRWRAPQDLTPWTGVRDATKSANMCTQQIYSRQWVPTTPATSASSYTGNEDCLYLDVYTPQTTTTPLPVFVWIHGGANNFGSAQSYDGTTLAVRENMIVVVIQYRLAALGFLSSSALGAGEDIFDASGNYGTLDQIKALTWVQNNIAAFGGDPTKVTVGGQSAGGAATVNMIMSPLTTGLFRYAAPISPAQSFTAPEDSLSNAMIDWLLQDDGMVTFGDWAAAATQRGTMSTSAIQLYLRGKSAVKILEACIEANYHLNPAGGETMPFHNPYMDGNVVPATDWVTTIGTGSYQHVPLLIGNAEYEEKPFMPLYGPPIKAGLGIPSSTTYDWSYLESAVLASPPTLTLAQVLGTAPVGTPGDQDIYDTVGHLSSRMWKATYTDATAEALMSNSPSNTIYAYLFQWDGGGDPALADFKFIIGAGHAMDVPFWFGQYDVDTFGYSFTTTNRQGRVLLMNAMMDYLGTFVYTGNPNKAGSSLTTWPKWSVSTPNLQTLNATTTSLALGTAQYELTVASVSAEEATWESGYGGYGAVLAILLSIL